jgi:hypothetical protein
VGASSRGVSAAPKEHLVGPKLVKGHEREGLLGTNFM